MERGGRVARWLRLPASYRMASAKTRDSQNLKMASSEEEFSAFLEPSPAVKIILFAWMAAVFIFYLLMFIPPFVSTIAAHFGLLKPLYHLQDKILPFFQTSDFDSNINSR